MLIRNFNIQLKLRNRNSLMAERLQNSRVMKMAQSLQELTRELRVIIRKNFL